MLWHSWGRWLIRWYYYSWKSFGNVMSFMLLGELEKLVPEAVLALLSTQMQIHHHHYHLLVSGLSFSLSKGLMFYYCRLHGFCEAMLDIDEFDVDATLTTWREAYVCALIPWCSCNPLGELFVGSFQYQRHSVKETNLSLLHGNVLLYEPVE